MFKKDIEDLKHRMSIEPDLIHLIKENNPPNVNLKIPSKRKLNFSSLKLVFMYIINKLFIYFHFLEINNIQLHFYY